MLQIWIKYFSQFWNNCAMEISIAIVVTTECYVMVTTISIEYRSSHKIETPSIFLTDDEQLWCCYLISSYFIISQKWLAFIIMLLIAKCDKAYYLPWNTLKCKMTKLTLLFCNDVWKIFCSNEICISINTLWT